MTIETKFNIGDWVWVLDNNQVMHRRIRVINTTTSAIDEVFIIYIMYATDNKDLKSEFKEHQVFKAKSELLASL